MARRVSLKDVAEAVGMSQTAVSLVLNNRETRLSEESKRLIRETAARLGYQPSRTARSLAMKSSQTVGLIVPDIGNPFFAMLAKELERLCRESGYSLFITNSDDRIESDCRQLVALDLRDVDGIVYVASDELRGGASDELRSALRGLSAPCVMVDRVIYDADCDKVLVDNERGAYLATRHLIEHGHTRIACLANARGSGNGRLRLEGYRRALAEAGIERVPELEIECAYRVESGYAVADSALDAGATAVFCTSDLIASGVLQRFYERGVRVPDDCSLVSFDNNAAFIFWGPGVTSVEQDVAELAARAFALLKERMEGYEGPARTNMLELGLVVRSSVRDLR